MTVQRFRTDVERTRHAAGWICMTVAVALIGGLAWLDIQSGRVTGTAIVLFALLVGLFAVGYRLAFKIQELFEIDVQERTYSVIRAGSRAGAGPLDALGPLQVQRRVREVGSEGKRRTIVEYVVHAAAHSAMDLYVETTAGKARRRMEALGQAWRLPCRSLGGAVRGPDELDVPLHDRLRDDRAARTPAELQPEWCVRIEPLSLGYAIVSSHRAWTPLATSAVAIFVGILIVKQVSSSDIVSAALGEGDPLARVLVSLSGVVGLVMLWLVAQGVRDTFFPGTVLVTDRGVRYRFSRMPFREIEEVTAHFPVEVVGDRRSIVLGTTFCPPAATDVVAHELQRLIIEVAEANPHARAAS